MPASWQFATPLGKVRVTPLTALLRSKRTAICSGVNFGRVERNKFPVGVWARALAQRLARGD
jgi:hypothetical protein